MKYIPGYLDSFISPITGSLSANTIIPLSYNYILLGDREGHAVEGPALIDVWLDIRNIKEKLSNTHFILQTSSPDFIKSQALDQLTSGFLYNNAEGILSIAVPGPGSIALPHNQVFLGDVDNLAQASPTILMDNLPDVTFHNLLIGNSSNRLIAQQRVDVLNLPPFLSSTLSDLTSIPPGAPVNFGLYNLYTGSPGLSFSEPIAPGITLKIDISNLPNLSKGKLWMGVINIIPPVITFIPDPPYITFTGLNWDVRGALPIVGDSYAVPQEVGLDPGTIFIGDFLNPGQITQTGLPFGRMFIGNGFGQITNVGLLPFQLFSGNPDASGQIIPITILDRTNLPILPLNNLWVGDGLDQAFPIPVGIGLNTISGLNIADTTVIPGSYTSAHITVNAQGQITSASNGEGSGGTVTEITLGTGLTGTPNPITTAGTISITPTGVVPGEYFYLTATINAEGQVVTAIDNTSTISDMQDNIATNTSNIATNTSSINTINTTLFDPVTGIVNAVAVLNTAVFAPVTGLVAQVSSNTDKIHEIIDTSDR